MPSPIEEIKSRLDIVDVINEYVPLKSSGTNWKAKCPFHNEKTPSFMVSRERGSWHCFGCSRGGDLIAFVEEMEGLDFPETLRLLAKRAGVQLKDFDPKLQTQRTKVLDVLRWVSRYWQEVLHKSTDADPARKYLTERGLSSGSLEDFALGFAPTGWDNTYQALKKKGFTDDDIFQAGLTIKKERGSSFYDRFRGRIMFPINDVHGVVVGFTGRVLEAVIDPSAPPQAKYVNSPQTLVYNKSQVLYGLDVAKQEIKKEKLAIIVEGNMDCVLSHQAGVANTVAVSGTALTAEQVQLVKRFSPKVAFCFDQDQAGVQAVVRGVEQALRAEITTTIVRLPFGKDPADVIVKDPAAWKKAVAAAEPVMEYFFTQALDGRDLNAVEDKKTIAKELLPIITLLNDEIERTHYLQKLADLLRVEESALRASLIKGRFIAELTQGKPGQPARATPIDRFRAVSERFLALLIKQPKWLEQLAGNFDDQLLVGADLQALYKQLAIWYTERRLTNHDDVVQLTSSLNPELQQLADLLSMLGDKEYDEVSSSGQEHDLLDLNTTLKRHALSLELKRLEIDIRGLEQQTGGHAGKMEPLIERFQAITDQLRTLD